jgi:hypothetical protein
MHHGGGSTRRLPERMLLELFRSRARYFARFYPAPARLGYAALMAIGALWNSLYTIVRPVPGMTRRTLWAIAATSFAR